MKDRYLSPSADNKEKHSDAVREGRRGDTHITTPESGTVNTSPRITLDIIIFEKLRKLLHSDLRLLILIMHNRTCILSLSLSFSAHVHCIIRVQTSPTLFHISPTLF